MTRRFVLAGRVCVFMLVVAALASSLNLNALPLPNAGDSAGKHDAAASNSPVFLVAPSIAVAGRPTAMAAGDLNGDGAADLVVANAQTGNVDVLLGDGKGKFQAPVHYKIGGSPVALMVGDFAGHGKIDVAVANRTGNSVSILLGKGDGTFQAAVTYPVGSGPVALAAGDFNGDGHPDLLVANAGSNTLAVLTNNGDGTFQTAKFYSVTASPLAIAIADFNGDGKLDIASGNADGTVNILLGDGAGRFNLAATMTSATCVSALVVGDFNRDGKSDLAVADPVASTVNIFLGHGDGTFQSSSVLPVGNGPVSLALEDVNADGVPDLLAVNKSGNTVSVMLGAGDGSFQPSADFVVGNSPVAVAIADFNGDGHLDFATANSADGTVTMPLGNGDGTFQAARSYSAGVQPVSIASGNLNGSKIPALVVANYCGSDLTCSTAGSVAVFLADDKGVYRLSSTYTVGAGPVSVALADLKGDSNLDIVALNRLDKSASVMLGLGDGTFRMPMTFSLAGAPVAIAVGDLNKDGKPDLAVLEDCGSAKCSQAGSVEILMGAGDGSFQSVSSYPVGYSPVSVAVGAINGDKNLDLVVANRCGNDASCQSPGTATVLLGDGTGKFTPGTDIALGNSPSSIALGNLTGSGLDLVVSRSTDNTVAVLHGNGDGTFQAAVPYAVGNNPGSLVVADFNGDGNADVAVANVNDSTVSVLFGKGDGTLQPAAALAVGSGPTSLTAVGRINTRHASLATTNGNGGSSSPGAEFTLLPNLGTDPPLASFVLVPSPTPSNVNQGVLLTATLTGVTPNPAPSGTVTFDSGATALADCTGVSIIQGVSPSLISTATCTTHMLTAGSDSLTAVYSGDAVYDTGVGETSPAVTQTVNALAATLGLSSPGPSTFGASVTFTAQLSGVALTPVVPSGNVAFTANGTTITGCGAVAVNASGTATCSTSSLVAPSDAITATYSGDSNFTVDNPATMTQTVNKANTTTAVTSSVNPSVFGQSVTFTATVTDSSTGSTAVPTGSVQFVVDGVNFGSPVTLTGATSNSSTATSQATATLSVAGSPHTVTANYVNADGNFSNSTGTLTGGQTVAAALSLAGPTQTTADVGVAYSSSLTASGGTSPYTYSIKSGSLPAGLNLNTSTGAITGTPTTAGAPACTAQVTDSLNATATTSCIITVAAALSLAGPTQTTADVGVAYSSSLTVSGGTSPYTYSIKSGSLPAGLSLNTSTGAITGTPTTAGTSNCTAQVTDAVSGTATSSCTITVVAPPTISKVFGASSILLNGSTTLQFTIANPNSTAALTGVGFDDPMPSGLAASGSATCNGTAVSVTATDVKLTGAMIAASAQCIFQVNVTGITGGVQNNVTGNVTSANGGTGLTASASIKVQDFQLPNSLTPISIIQGFSDSTTMVQIQSLGSFASTQIAGTCAPLPAAFTYATCTVNSGNLITLTPDGTATVSVQVTLLPSTNNSQGTLTPPGPYTLTLTFTASGLTHTVPLSVTAVQNIPPTCTTTASTTPFLVVGSDNQTVTATVVCTDPQTGNLTTATVNWGDGTANSTASAVPGVPNSFTHKYAQPTQGMAYVVSGYGTDVALLLSNDVSESVSLNPQVPVIPGNSAMVTAPLLPSATFSGTVNFACVSVSTTNGTSTALSDYGLGCTFNPASGSLATTTQVQVTVSTKATSGASQRASSQNRRFGAIYALWLGIPGIVFLGLGITAKTQSRRLGLRTLRFLGLWIALSLTLLIVACGGGFTQPGPLPGPGGTPSGVYFLTVDGTDSNGTVQTTIVVEILVGV